MATYTEIRAPWPGVKVTITLPNPLLQDGRATQSRVHIKRLKTGGRKTYALSSDRETLILPFLLTRMKSIELERFLTAYRSATWHLTLYDGSTWEVDLVGEPVTREATGKLGYQNTQTTGTESVEVTVTLSAKRLT